MSRNDRRRPAAGKTENVSDELINQRIEAARRHLAALRQGRDAVPDERPAETSAQRHLAAAMKELEAVEELVRQREKLAADEHEIAGHRLEGEVLAESDEWHLGLFAIESDAILMMDGATGRFLDANPAATRLYGYSHEEFLKLKPTDISAEPKKTGHAIAAREVSVPLRWHRKKDGTVFPVEISGNYFTSRGRGIHVAAIRDITERKQVEQRLLTSREQLRTLAARLRSVREEERARIAREIHDEMGHAFTDLKLDLAWLDRRLDEKKQSGQSGVRRRIATMMKRVESDLNTARRISTELRPAVLDTSGFVAAMEWGAKQFEERSGIECELDLPVEGMALDAGRSTAMFRIFQEILANIVRHAGATRVRTRLRAEAGQVVMEVSDNGRGITHREMADASAVGLLGMRERAREFGGEVVIHGKPGEGTTVRVAIPLKRP